MKKINLKNKINKIKKSLGFSLLEVLVSSLLFTLGVVGVLQMQSLLTQATFSAKYRGEAVDLVNQMITTIMLDSNNLSTYADGGTAVFRTKWDAEISQKLPLGKSTITVNGGDLTIKVNWQSKQDLDQREYSIVTYLGY